MKAIVLFKSGKFYNDQVSMFSVYLNVIALLTLLAILLFLLGRNYWPKRHNASRKFTRPSLNHATKPH